MIKNTLYSINLLIFDFPDCLFSTANQNQICNLIKTIMGICPPIQHFWHTVTKTLSRCLGCSIPLSLSLCLLGDISPINSTTQNARPILIALTVTKKTILFKYYFCKNTSTLSALHSDHNSKSQFLVNCIPNSLFLAQFS